MAVRNIAITDTLEKFRTEFNDMTANDFGDIANLSGSISSTNLVGAMNETISIATSTAGWKMRDSTSTTQLVGGGDIATFLGTSNQINAVVSSPDTLTLSLNPTVEVTTSVKAGTLTIAAGSITDTSGTINIGDEDITGTGTITGANIVGTTLKGNNLQSRSGNVVRVPTTETLKIDGTLQFEGTNNDNELTIAIVDPTADRTITFPDATGTIALTNTTGYATSTIFSSAVTLIIYNSSGVAQKTIVGSAT
tara:strand:+ start:11765 stop:12517 length:753 start_codon:yes stop_codon:yes gene_type:complete